jgi:hypothetical protein
VSPAARQLHSGALLLDSSHVRDSGGDSGAYIELSRLFELTLQVSQPLTSILTLLVLDLLGSDPRRLQPVE